MTNSHHIFVMAALEAAIQHACVRAQKNLDGRVKAGHDEKGLMDQS